MGLPAKKEEPLTLTVDKFGRVVIPLEVREAMGLHPGTKMELSRETDTAIYLKVVEENPAVEWANGVPVIKGTGGNIDSRKALSEVHKARAGKHLGLSK